MRDKKTKILLSDEAINYLAELIERNKFEIENDIYHCELGVRELLQILKKKEVLEESFCKTALNC